MEPDYENMNDRVMRLPIAEELKQDMVDGITYCKKFSVSPPSHYNNSKDYPFKVHLSFVFST